MAVFVILAMFKVKNKIEQYLRGKEKLLCCCLNVAAVLMLKMFLFALSLDC
jgi:hypothetical protein